MNRLFEISFGVLFCVFNSNFGIHEDKLSLKWTYLTKMNCGLILVERGFSQYLYEEYWNDERKTK